MWTYSLGDEQIGLVAMGAGDQVVTPITAEFDNVRIYALKNRPRR